MKKKVWMMMSALLFLLTVQVSTPLSVRAADGTLIIALSSSEVKVGDTVEVIVTAQGPGGEKASSNMELSYDSSLFTFVSCNAAHYTGGESGQIGAKGSNFTVVLKAKAPGSGSFTASGTDGKVSGTDTILSSMSSAGAKVKATGAAAAEPITPEPLSAATPEVTSATVPATTDPETTSGSLSADNTTGSDNTDPSIGQPTETGAYWYDAESATFEPYDGDQASSENEYLTEANTKLLDQYDKARSFNRMVEAGMGFVILVMLVLIVNLLLGRRGRKEVDYQEEPEKEEELAEETLPKEAAEPDASKPEVKSKKAEDVIAEASVIAEDFAKKAGNAHPNTAPVSEAEPEAKSEPELAPESEVKPESELEPEVKPEPESELKAEAEPETKPEPEVKPEAEAEKSAEQTIEAAGQTAVKQDTGKINLEALSKDTDLEITDLDEI